MDLNNVNGLISFEFGLFLVDEDYHTLTNAELKIKSYDKTKTFDVNGTVREDKAIVFDTSNIEIANVMELFPEGYRQIFSNLRTKNDVLNTPNINYFYTPFKLVETKAPTGYKNEEIIFFAYVHPQFEYDSNDNITNISFSIRAEYYSTFMTNDDSDIDYTQLRDYDYLHDRENHLARTCGYENNIYYGQIVTTNDDIWGSGCFEVMYYFVNQKGSVDLKITNTVNNVLSYNATNNKKLTYNISVKNNGNITSSNNVIVTNVPDGITVKEDTISDKGVYNKTKNTISWVLSSLSPSESHTFTYEAIVPDSAIANNEYIGNSYIMSDQIEIQVKSEDTVVKFEEFNNPDQTNPKTGILDINNIFLLIAILLIMFFAVRKKKSYLR